MFEKNELLLILNKALATGADFAELFFEEKNINNFNYREGAVEYINKNLIKGVGIRIIKGIESAYGYTNKLTLNEVIDLAIKLSLRFKGKQKTWVNKLHKKTYKLSKNIILPCDVCIKEKIKYLKKIYDGAKTNNKLINEIITTIHDELQKVTIVNSKGLYVTEDRIRIGLSCSVYVKSGETLENASEGLNFTKGYEIFKDVNLKEFGKNVFLKAIKRLSAVSCPSGLMPVVIDRGNGIIFHEACGHSLEGTRVARSTSVYSNKLGHKIASSSVTLIDDGSLNEYYGYNKIDDEGHKTRKNILIKNGILKKYLLDYKTAKILNLPISGSGRRESYKYVSAARMNNTYIDNGSINPNDIIKSVKNGLYVKKIKGGNVIVETGNFNFFVEEGYLIKDGKITDMIKGANLTGNSYNILNKVEMVGNDLLISKAGGLCSSISGRIPISVGQPTVKISNMLVGGTSE